MTWRRFWRKHNEPEPDPPVAAGDHAAVPRSPRPSAASAVAPSERARAGRRADLQRRRQEALFDVERAELALGPDNPWQERIALLTETLATVDADRRALDELPPLPTVALPPTPIEDMRATGDEPIEVRFRIGGESFVFREETDWDQRGGPTVRGDLRHQAGDPTALVPSATPPDRRAAMAEHLADSIGVFAMDLRDRALEGIPLPEAATLVDLASPCPVCGGWRDWHGRCAECARRDLRRQALRAEAERIEADRATEAEEYHRWVERLPIARRRLAQIEADLAALG